MACAAFLGTFALTFLLASLSWRFIERPLLKRKNIWAPAPRELKKGRRTLLGRRPRIFGLRGFGIRQIERDLLPFERWIQNVQSLLNGPQGPVLQRDAIEVFVERIQRVRL